MKLSIALVAVCFTLGFPHDCAGQRYAILAPRIVRPHSTYEIVAANVRADRDLNLRYDIVNEREVVLKSQRAPVKPHQLEQINIGIGSLQAGNYRLDVWDEDRNQLLNSTALEFSSKSYTVLFQTDKPVYKAGDKVQFRVLFLQPNLKPVPKSTATAANAVFITDPNRYRMQQWVNVTLQSGVFEGSFHLAPHTTLGTWSISALFNGQHYTDSFTVQDYTLPLFRVEISSTTKAFICQEGSMGLRISARYMGGGPVHANATVVLLANYNNYPTQKKEFSRQSLEFKGTRDVYFPTSLVKENCNEARNVWFNVTVTDILSGTTYTETRKFTLHSVLYNMDVLGVIEGFHPGVPLDLQVQLTSVGGSPLARQQLSVRYWLLDSERDRSAVKTEQVTAITSDQGIVGVRINTREDTSAVEVEGIYRTGTFQLLYLDPFFEIMNVSFLQAYTTEAFYNTNGNITLKLYSNVHFNRIYYIGHCRRAVCTSGTANLGTLQKRHDLYLQPDPRIVSPMMLLVFTVMEDGQILSSSLVVRFQAAERNHFQVTASNMPGSEERLEQFQSFDVTAEKGAFVALLGVDERITVGQSTKNDITLRRIERAMQSPKADLELWSAYDSFGNVGVTLLSNGYLPDVGPVFHAGLRIASRVTVNAAEMLENAENVRHEFPETWLWESWIGPGGVHKLQKRLPHTLTTWVVTGFSVGEKHGLVILKKPVRIRTVRNVYAQLHVPAAIRRNEPVAASCLIHNNDNATVSVTIEGLPGSRVPSPVVLAVGETKSIPFSLLETEVGEVTLKVLLRNQKGAIVDSLSQAITVHPDGVVKVLEDVRFTIFDRHSSANFSMGLNRSAIDRNCGAPENTVSVIGSVININQFDLERMVASSYGNGDDNLLFLQSAIAVYEYLSTTEHLTKGRRDKLIGSIEVAYQQHLQFRLDDGSFSVFGRLHECGGVWFTAATIETLLKGSAHVTVDSNVIERGLGWLAKRQQDDGSFNETCKIVHPHIQSTGGKELSLSSSVMFAFLGRPIHARYTGVVNRTMSMLTDEPIEDVYVLAKTVYLFSLRNDTMHSPAQVSRMKQLNKLSVKEGLYKYWRVSDALGTPSAPSRNLGATAYALLANLRYVSSQDVQESINDLSRVVQWIQQNSFGREQLTPSVETIVALQALKTLHGKLPAIGTNMNVAVGRHRLQVNGTNRDLLQTVKLGNEIRNVCISVKGTGIIVIKLSHRCTVSPSSKKDAATPPGPGGISQVLNVKKGASQTPHQAAWTICVNHNLCADQCFLNNIGVYMPTGFKLLEIPRGNITINSAISIAHNTHLKMVYEATGRSAHCFSLKGQNYFPLRSANYGFIEVCTMNGRGHCAFQNFR